MNQINKTIKLTYRRHDFENIYFKDGQGNIFWSKPVKQYFIIALVFMIVALTSLVYAIFTNQLWGFTVFFFFLFAVAFFTYAKQATIIFRWKKQVIRYLNNLAKIQNHELTLTNEAIALIQDDKETIDKWSNFTKVTFDNESITLYGFDIYLFPKQSMSITDYEYLKQFISGKIQDGLQQIPATI
ncbi:hypothetical protein BH11BAC3_BH11BAC3_42460 [soil metagenome]